MNQTLAVLIAIFVALAGLAMSVVHADEELKADFATADLLSAVEATGILTEFKLGLRVRLQPGWKVYWRSPGDAGLPTRLLLDRESFPKQHLQLDYPVPERFSLFGLDTYGYGDEVVFPIRLSGHQAGQPLHLKTRLDALVCSDICVPFAGPVSLSIPAGPVAASTHAQAIARATALVPRVFAQSGIGVDSVVFDKAQASLFVHLASSDEEIEDIFVEADLNGLSFAQPVNHGNGLYQIAVSGADQALDLDNQPVRLTLRSARWTSEQSLLISAVSDSSSDGIGLLWMLLIALGGGLVLNIMPCVLPVLSLKLTSIISMSSSQPRIIKLRLFCGAAGILCSFALLTGGLVLLKLAGARIGWGIQFQNLYFLIAMALLMGVFTLVLLDKLSLPVPQTSLKRQGNQLFSDFVSGFLATLLATPCSAPLVGTAVSFALSASVLSLVLILMTMGVGLALPWLILAMIPRLVLRIPKPGPWLGYVRPVLASGLILTIIWLLWLIAMASTLTLSALIATGLIVLWLVSVFMSRPFIWPTILGIIMVSFVGTGWFGMRPHQISNNQNVLVETASAWQPWSEQILADARQQQRAVFVDVTADWCVTCQVNKRLVLDNATTKQAFQDADVILLRADWTHPDDRIADYLLKHGRFGIPFNSLYLPGQAKPLFFSEILSVEKILAALEKIDKPV